jgi:UDP-N-acetylglucosamine:LPS N-acetylglucosamine transferase
VPERDLLAVPDLIKSLLADESRLAQMGAAMRRLARPDAAGEIADGLIALARRLA